jgi:hypothetical protein
MKKIAFYNLLLLCCCFLPGGCTEPYALQTNTFESALVVEATMTNELKNQQIKITRTFRFEDNAPNFEAGATVYVTDNDGNDYSFEENDGKYVSVNPFQAIPGKVYRLTIVTGDGKTYTSGSETLTTVNPIQDVVATFAVKDGQRGVQINAKSFDPANSSKYYRYEYEETYKIIAPKWANMTAVLGPPVPPETHQSVLLIPKEDLDTQICYGTQKSKDILLSTSVDLSEDREDFPVRFIGNDNYIISHRYSILVRQYIQSLAAYNFYKTLKEISGSGGVFSPTQPGFFYGNMKCVGDPNEKVIGFFEVASVSSKRIFFNYTDFFPGEGLPPYYVDCENVRFNYCFDPLDPQCNGAQLITTVNYNALLYYTGSTPTFTFVPPPCGDCTTFASNVIPPFWE